MGADPEDVRHKVIDNRRGIAAMAASVVVFIFNDALIKLAAETMPSVQAIGVRGIFATLWCALALAVTGVWRRMGGLGHPQVLTRGALEAASSIVFLVAMFHIPFAIATAVNLTTPLILAVLAALFLKEDVRWRRWLAIVVGFIGVLLVIQPSAGNINVRTWVALGASFLSAARDLIGRNLPAAIPTLVVSFASAITVAIVGCGWALVEGWQPMSLRAIYLLIGASFLLATGYQFLVIALRSGGELSVIGSLRYSSILWALAIGYVVWGDLPNSLAMCGIAVIVAAGLYILHRERIRRAG